MSIKQNEQGQWKLEGPPLFGDKSAFIPEDKFTCDLIYRICNYKSQALMGGTIKSYQEETVPLFLAHLKEVLPKKFESFIKAYPQYGEK